MCLLPYLSFPRAKSFFRSPFVGLTSALVRQSFHKPFQNALSHLGTYSTPHPSPHQVIPKTRFLSSSLLEPVGSVLEWLHLSFLVEARAKG